ncbi:MAG: BlaI/MecI/CopY family transcriptional regulator [Candidatus Zixiibacteriota bacterium]|nr:MAG: BlaI/MecI/CopY family transcriptional regulator [candidate division Zixibacteria bacterium]HHI02808.1 BlaI/MecI/CopY family transcriptional regulator [candidate division Zixibacteria bacterium]
MTDNQKISITFKPSGSGLEKFFGTLEAEVIDIVWKSSPVTIKRVLFFLNKNHNYAYTTAMTVMNRLVRKNILKRTKKSHSYVYTPLISKGEFLKLAVESIVSSLYNDYQTITSKTISRIKKAGTTKKSNKSS